MGLSKGEFFGRISIVKWFVSNCLNWLLGFCKGNQFRQFETVILTGAREKSWIEAWFWCECDEKERVAIGDFV